MKSGIELIAQERQEQLEKHWRTITSDVELNGDYQLATAAVRMLFTPEDKGFDLIQNFDIFRPLGWDDRIWRKMINKTYKERLIIAGALVAAELDRLQAIEMNENH